MKVRDVKMFLPYHMTNHSIIKIDSKVGSAIPRGVILDKRRGISLRTLGEKRNIRILTSWQFPDFLYSSVKMIGKVGSVFVLICWKFGQIKVFFNTVSRKTAETPFGDLN